MDGTGVGPTVRLITEGFYIIYVFFVRTRSNAFICFFQYISNWAMWDPFLVIWVCPTYYILSYSNGVLFIEIIQFFGRYITNLNILDSDLEQINKKRNHIKNKKVKWKDYCYLSKEKENKSKEATTYTSTPDRLNTKQQNNYVFTCQQNKT